MMLMLEVTHKLKKSQRTQDFILNNETHFQNLNGVLCKFNLFVFYWLLYNHFVKKRENAVRVCSILSRVINLPVGPSVLRY